MMFLAWLYLFQDWISEWSVSLLWSDWWQDLTGKETCTKNHLIQWVPDQNPELVNRRKWKLSISWMCEVVSFSVFEFLVPYLLNLFLKQSNVKRDHLTCELGKGKSVRLPGAGLSAWLQRSAETVKYLQTLGSADFQTRWLSIWFNAACYAGACRDPMDSRAYNILWGESCLGPDTWGCRNTFLRHTPAIHKRVSLQSGHIRTRGSVLLLS